ncbi:hypothetical protein B0H13DRAFT_2444168 [Mycena leptocephala]|nr:hypothetical protein B0H13DRAFT_2444168 [Mycena leptocephala]
MSEAVLGRIAEFREGDGACVIGLKPTASLPLLSYDLLCFLSAAVMALTTSTVNIAVLTIMKGHQFGWLCLASCGMDVILNAAALYWVTVGTSTKSLNGSGANRPLNDIHGNSITFALGAPTTPARNSFKPEIKPGNAFKMGPLSPTQATAPRMTIHVTTQSHVSPSPHAPGFGESCRSSETD